MTRKDLTQILKSQIPLTQAMGLRVSRCSLAKGVQFHLPLNKNHNHKGTAFGGSLVAGQALASWAWLMVLLNAKGVQAEVVVQRQSSEFLNPVDQDFYIETVKVATDEVRRFLHTLKRRGKARISMLARVLNAGELAATYNGEYVALMTSDKNNE